MRAARPGKPPPTIVTRSWGAKPEKAVSVASNNAAKPQAKPAPAKKPAVQDKSTNAIPAKK